MANAIIAKRDGRVIKIYHTKLPKPATNIYRYIFIMSLEIWKKQRVYKKCCPVFRGVVYSSSNHIGDSRICANGCRICIGDAY